MTSIVLGTISLNMMAGGLEKNIVLLANHLAACGNRVCLVTFDNPGAISFYPLAPSIEWYPVGRTRPHSPISFRDRLELISRIRDVLKKVGSPLVICFHHGVLPRFYLASFMMRLKLICSERNSLTLYKHIRQAKWSLGFLMLALANKITVQFPGYVQDYPFWLKRRISVIHNPVDPTTRRATPSQPGPDGRFRLLTVGRLCAQKNQKLLIDAFAQQCQYYPQWNLHIVGDGEAYDELAAHIRDLNLSSRIFLEGRQENIPVWLASAHLFCLLSKWEGFPNALAEAMAHGLPSIGLKSCTGVRDLIADGETGLLADEQGVAQSLRELMEFPEKRKAMGDAAAEFISRYPPEASFQRWDALLAQLEDKR